MCKAIYCTFFIIAKKQKQLYYPLVPKWLRKLWNTNMMKYYVIIKNSF